MYLLDPSISAPRGQSAHEREAAETIALPALIEGLDERHHEMIQGESTIRKAIAKLDIIHYRFCVWFKIVGEKLEKNVQIRNSIKNLVYEFYEEKGL